MSREEIIRMAREAGLTVNPPSWGYTEHYHFAGFEQPFERFFQAAYAAGAAVEREKLAAWMMRQGYATGHGDSIEKLLEELEWQIVEREREACAKVCDVLAVHPEYASDITKVAAQAIRARGEK